MSPAVLAMAGPCDPKVRSCVFCNQVFKDGESWFKIGYPWAGYIGAHDICSARKDAELRARLTQRTP